MSYITREFILEKTRSKQGAIVDAVGKLGTWPFRRTISYHIGINCDAIDAQHGLLRVLRRGRTIATAELPPPAGALRRLQRAWSALMHPRHASRAAAGQSAPAWEDLLHPRRPR